MKNVLRNIWYPAGWSVHLKRGELLARTFLDEPIVMFRDADGQPRALQDRCPHRFAPLSMGILAEPGVVQCPYHGLRFNGAGACVLNPQGPPPRKATVRSYPMVERYSALWIWMGEPELANPDLIPEFDFLVPENWAVGTGYIQVNCHYEIEADNIMDLSHIEFLHPLFSSDAVRAGKVTSSLQGETVFTSRMILNDDPPSFIRDAFEIPGGARVDRWLDVRWNAPSLMALWTGGVEHGRPVAEGVVWHAAHFFTPESEDRTHYFWSICFPRTMGERAEQMAREQEIALKGPLETEDAPMIEAVQRRMKGADLWSLNPVLLPGDAGAVRARRVLQARIQAEKDAEAKPVASSSAANAVA